MLRERMTTYRINLYKLGTVLTGKVKCYIWVTQNVYTINLIRIVILQILQCMATTKKVTPGREGYKILFNENTVIMNYKFAAAAAK